MRKKHPQPASGKGLQLLAKSIESGQINQESISQNLLFSPSTHVLGPEPAEQHQAFKFPFSSSSGSPDKPWFGNPQVPDHPVYSSAAKIIESTGLNLSTIHHSSIKASNEKPNDGLASLADAATLNSRYGMEYISYSEQSTYEAVQALASNPVNIAQLASHLCKKYNTSIASRVSVQDSTASNLAEMQPCTLSIGECPAAPYVSLLKQAENDAVNARAKNKLRFASLYSEYVLECAKLQNLSKKAVQKAGQLGPNRACRVIHEAGMKLNAGSFVWARKQISVPDIGPISEDVGRGVSDQARDQFKALSHTSSPSRTYNLESTDIELQSETHAASASLGHSAKTFNPQEATDRVEPSVWSHLDGSISLPNHLAPSILSLQTLAVQLETPSAAGNSVDNNSNEPNVCGLVNKAAGRRSQPACVATTEQHTHLGCSSLKSSESEVREMRKRGNTHVCSKYF